MFVRRDLVHRTIETPRGQEIEVRMFRQSRPSLTFLGPKSHVSQKELGQCSRRSEHYLSFVAVLQFPIHQFQMRPVMQDYVWRVMRAKTFIKWDP